MYDNFGPLSNGHFWQLCFHVAKRIERLVYATIFFNCRTEIVSALNVIDKQFSPRRNHEYSFPVRSGFAKCFRYRWTARSRQGDSRVDQTAVENTAPLRARAAFKSAFATLTARPAKALISIHGSALPFLTSSSATIRRPGSSTVAKPRSPKAFNSVDLPPPEQPVSRIN